MTESIQVANLPVEDQVESWVKRCADLTRMGVAEHFWAFLDPSSCDIPAIVLDGLEKFGPQVHLQPVSVDERMPEPEDCEFNHGATIGFCWCWTPHTYAGGPAGCWTFEPLEWAEDATHWLPAHAMPLPTHD